MHGTFLHRQGATNGAPPVLMIRTETAAVAFAEAAVEARLWERALALSEVDSASLAGVSGEELT